MINPVRSAKLKKYPEGNIYQFYKENVALYMQAIGAKGHTGVDIATFEGDEILAAHDGTVVEVYNDANGYGHHVRIVSAKQPDGTYIETIYGHLSSNIPVIVGQEVKAGDVIGSESNTGFVISGGTAYWSNAPAGKGVHLHWGLRILGDIAPGPQVSYSGGKYNYSIINYTNGLFGYIDPMPFIKPMYTLYKDPLAIKEIYAVEGITKHHIATYPTLVAGKRLGKWDFATVTEIPFADITTFANLTEGDEKVLSPEQIIDTPRD